MKLSLQQYSRYFFVGSVVGVSAVILRELVAFLAEDKVGIYFGTVLFAYAYGIIISFFLHKIFTFKKHLEANNKQLHFCTFTIVAIIGMFLTGAFSLLFRYGCHLDSLIPRYSGSCAFILASLTSSAITYYLHIRYSTGEPTESSTTK